MSAMLTGLVSLSISGGVVALALFALLPLLRRHMSRAWQYYIWLLVAARLLLPVALPVNLVDSLYQAAELPELAARASVGALATAPQDGPGEETPAAPGVHNATPGEPVVAEGALPEAGAAADPAPVVPLRRPFPVVAALVAGWAAVASVLLARKLIAYRRFVRRIRTGAVEVRSAALVDAYAAACVALHIRRPPALLVNPLAPAPLLAGAFRPFVVLPDEALSCDDAYHAALHELTHHKRRDVWYKWLFELVTCIHWFNPLVHLARREANRACELACDEAVLRTLAEPDRRGYGDTLLRLVCAAKPYPHTVASVTLGEDAKQIKERLGSIMSFQSKPKRYAVISLALSAVLICGALLCGWAAPPLRGKTMTSGSTNFDGVYRLNDALFFNSYFNNQYIVDMAWNVDPQRYDTKYSVTVNEVSYVVCFPPETQAQASNPAVQEAVQLGIRDIKAGGWSAEGDLALRYIAIPHLYGPYTQSADELLTKFYNENNLSNLVAVKRKASQPAMEQVALRAYTDRNEDLFSNLANDLSAAMRDTLARRTLADKELDYFTLLACEMDATQSAEFVQLCYDAGFDEGFYALADELAPAQLMEYARRALKDSRTKAFSAFACELGPTELGELATQAYNERNIAGFSICMDELSQAQLSALAGRAYSDGRIDFFATLLDELTSDEILSYARRAHAENKASFTAVLFNELSDNEIEAITGKKVE